VSRWMVFEWDRSDGQSGPTRCARRAESPEAGALERVLEWGLPPGAVVRVKDCGEWVGAWMVCGSVDSPKVEKREGDL